MLFTAHPGKEHPIRQPDPYRGVLNLAPLPGPFGEAIGPIVVPHSRCTMIFLTVHLSKASSPRSLDTLHALRATNDTDFLASNACDVHSARLLVPMHALPAHISDDLWASKGCNACSTLSLVSLHALPARKCTDFQALNGCNIHSTPSLVPLHAVRAINDTVFQGIADPQCTSPAQQGAAD